MISMNTDFPIAPDLFELYAKELREKYEFDKDFRSAMALAFMIETMGVLETAKAFECVCGIKDVYLKNLKDIRLKLELRGGENLVKRTAERYSAG